MNYNMTYFCGVPIVFYKCPCCGYDTRERNVHITSTNTLQDKIMKKFIAESTLLVASIICAILSLIELVNSVIDYTHYVNL